MQTVPPSGDPKPRGALRLVASSAQRAAAALPPLQSTRLLDRVRERIRGLHYSRSTELTYLQWIKGFIRFHGIRNPAEMGGAEVEAYLTWLADARGVSASTHRQALSALIFLYAKVLQVQLPWLEAIGRPRVPKRLPVVLSREEVAAVLAGLEGTLGLFGRLLYGTGLRIHEAANGYRTAESQRELADARAAEHARLRAQQQAEAELRAERDRQRLALELTKMKKRGTQVCSHAGRNTLVGYVEDFTDEKLKVLVSSAHVTSVPSVAVRVEPGTLRWDDFATWWLCK